MNISLNEKHAQLDAHNAKQLATFARESDDLTTINNTKPGTPAGHENVLRAIPVIARGISGTIPGTQPHSALR
jgi:hypothetical protein